MTWLEHHRESELYAVKAELLLREGNTEEAQKLYLQAATNEIRALDDLEPSKTRTLGISVVSAVSLFYKAFRFTEAESVAYKWMASEYLPGFARDQLRGLLQSIWSEQVRERAGVGFAPGQVIVSVKGGEIVEGGAPLDVIVAKVQTVQSLFYRTAEFLRGLPHRKRGAPSQEIQETCRPWLFQTAPGSYQFAVAVQEPRQRELFPTDVPASKEVADQFLNILRASIEDPDQTLAELVPDVEYQGTFLKLTRNLAPSGRTFDQLDVRSSQETHPITLLPSTRKTVGDAIRRKPSKSLEPTEREEELHGILRAVHLDRDWLEVTVDQRHVRVDEVGETVDDLIGPMVNRRVIVRVIRDSHDKYRFRDIESED